MHGSLPLRSRAFWLRQMRQWHWISAAVCLIGMLAFALTGITLNHAGQIEAKPQVTARSAQLPDDLLRAAKAAQQSAKQSLPPGLRTWVEQRLGITVGDREAEWSQEIYLSLPRPGTIARQRQTAAFAKCRLSRYYVTTAHSGKPG